MISRPLLLLATALMPAIATAQPSLEPISFKLAQHEGDAGADQIQFTVEMRSDTGHNILSRSMRTADLTGLDSARLMSDRAGGVRFAIRREAGTLACEGTAVRGRATGDCRFAADPAFVDALTRRGIARPSPRQGFYLAMQNVGLALADELKRQGYATPRIDQLVACGIHKVDAPYVRAMAAAGYRAGTVEKLVAFRIHGISPDWIGGLVAADKSLARLPADELVALRIHGVSPEWVRELAVLGYSGLSAGQLVTMRIHGVSPGFIRRVQASGRGHVAPERLVQMRILGPRADLGL